MIAPRSQPAPSTQHEVGTNAHVKRAVPVAVVMTLAATVGSGVLNYTYGLALAFILPVKQYALYGGAQALLLITGTMANAAVPWALAHALARAPAQTAYRRSIVAAGSRLNLLAGIAAAGAVIPISAWLGTVYVALAVGLASFAYFVASTAMGYAQGTSRFGLLAILIFGEVAIKVAFGLGSVSFGGGVVYAITAAALGAFAIAAVGGFAMGSDFVLWGRERPVEGLARAATGMAGIQAIVAALTSLCVIIGLERYGAGSTTAHLQIAVTLGQVPIYLAIAVSLAGFNALARASNVEYERASGLEQYLILAAPAAVILASLPTQILDGCLPDRLHGAGPLLPWTSAAGFVFGFVILQTTWLKAARSFRRGLMTLSAALGCSVALMLFLASLWSVRGLAAGALGSALLTCAGLWRADAPLPMGTLRPSRWTILTVALAIALVAFHRHPLPWLALSVLLFALACSLAIRRRSPTTLGGVA
jgi:O-antigen/teichoic acid export membrane protein